MKKYTICKEMAWGIRWRRRETLGEKDRRTWEVQDHMEKRKESWDFWRWVGLRFPKNNALFVFRKIIYSVNTFWMFTVFKPIVLLFVICTDILFEMNIDSFVTSTFVSLCISTLTIVISKCPSINIWNQIQRQCSLIWCGILSA